MKKIIGIKGIIVLCVFIVSFWFRHGLIFAGAEEELSFYNYNKSLELYSHIWYGAGTGFPILTGIQRFPYFFILKPLYQMGVSNIYLQSITFLVLITTGILSVFYLIKETIANDLREPWKKIIPFLSSLFYFLNPFSMTQIWGRGLSYQIFAFALLPAFLLFFVLSLQKKNLILCIVGAILSFLLSTAYVSPAIVVASWANITIYFIFYILKNISEKRNIFFAIQAFMLLILLWLLLNSFWIYPVIRFGKEMLEGNLSLHDNIGSLKALAANSHLFNVLALIHREYYDQTYNGFSSNFIIILISFLLPLFAFISLKSLNKSIYFAFFSSLFLISIFVSIGANFPTGFILVWLFKTFPILQVLRNPYEKFGLNLTLAYAPFFATGLLILAEKLALFYKNQKLRNFFVFLLTVLTFIVLVWPMWRGDFAGGAKANFWVEIPKYYEQANNWLNSQMGDFNILHLPFRPDDGITFTWEHPYEGIEPSEFLFDKKSIAREFGANKDYYSALLDRFGARLNYKELPFWSEDFKDFREDQLSKELAKLNVRFLILHFDTDYEKRRAINPEETREYLTKQSNITKVKEFGKLEVYRVEIPEAVDLIYSPEGRTTYKKIDPSNYIVDVKNAPNNINLYFLQQFHPSWEAYIDGKRINLHSKAFSYANKWEIEKTGNYQVVIKFIQQDIVALSYKISLISFGVLVIILLFYFLRVKSLSFK